MHEVCLSLSVPHFLSFAVDTGLGVSVVGEGGIVGQRGSGRSLSQCQDRGLIRERECFASVGRWGLGPAGCLWSWPDFRLVNKRDTNTHTRSYTNTTAQCHTLRVPGPGCGTSPFSRLLSSSFLQHSSSAWGVLFSRLDLLTQSP